MSDKHEWTPEGLRMTAAKLVYSSNHYLYHEMPDTEAAVMGDALFLAADQMEALSAATQALTDMGCEPREGVWMKPCDRCDGEGDGFAITRTLGPMSPATCPDCCGTGWLPITRKSGGEGGVGCK